MLTQAKLLSLISNRFVELIILPTEQCNFRCVYCYEDFAIGKMKQNTILALKIFIKNRVPELDCLKISWFGGEPLAAKDIVYDICAYIKSLQINWPHFVFQSEMTTNGFLLKQDIFSKLISLGVNRFQISLDGTEKVHDKTRIRLNHSGTFKTIWHNLLVMKHSPLSFLIILRIHVTPDNVDNIYDLVNDIKLEFSNDNRFCVFFKAIENLGGPNKNSFTVIQGKDKKTILENLYQHLDNKIARKTLTDSGPYVCYAAQTNSFVIRADGRVGKCTVAFHDARNTVGQLNDDGTIQIDKNKLALWTRGLYSQNLGELSCPMYNLPQSKKLNIPISSGV